MSEVKFLKVVNGLPKQMDSSVDQVTLNSFSIQGSGPVLSGSGLDLKNLTLSNLANGVNAADAINKGQLDAAIAGISVNIAFAQEVYVAKNGNDATANGSLNKPYLTIQAAMNSILDSSPSKRYLIKVEAGSYTEGAMTLKPNVFVVGDLKEAVRVTATSVTMDPSFNANSSFDNRSGLGRIILTGACNFDWNAVTSAAGKLYFTEVSFVSSVTMNGYNNAIAQAQFDSCQFFNTLTISGINVGVFKDNISFNNIILNQHPNGGMASILNAVGGYCNNLTLTTTVSDFGRRCSVFLRAFWCENLIINGPSSYADADLVSQGKSSTQKLNGGQLIALSPRINHDLETQMLRPLTTNSHNLGDWGKQYFFNFAYVQGSSGTDLYVLSTMENYDPAGDTSGKNIFINADAYGLKPNVSGGNIELETAAVSGTGVKGKVQVKARELDMTSSKITNLASGSANNDAVNVGQLNSAIAAVSSVPNLQRDFTAEVAIVNKDVVFISSADSVSPAQADDVNSSICVGFAIASANASDPVTIRNEGVVPGFSGLTPGARYYLSAASAGAITNVAPSTSGEVVYQVGIAKNATELLIQKQFMYVVT